ncbi:MAG: FHA domain-containing protein [Kofleriaceae bacterium]
MQRLARELRLELARGRALGPAPADQRRPPPRAVGFVMTHWNLIQPGLAATPDPGVALVAIDTRRDAVCGALWLAARPGHPTVAIIGRHSACDLALADDAALSLRHLAVVLDADGRAADVGYRLLDLRTGLAFIDEAGRALEAATARGPAFVRVGRYLVLCFPTGGAPWPRDVVAAATRLPARQFLDLRAAAPGPAAPGSGLAAGTSSGLAAGTSPRRADLPEASTLAFLAALHGPARARVDLRVADAALAGTLTVRSALGRDEIAVGDDQLAGGVVLGRYHRCDSGGAAALALERISRVHALVLTSGGRVWLVDVASTNGVAVDGKPVRICAIDDGAVAELGGVATVAWASALVDAGG